MPALEGINRDEMFPRAMVRVLQTTRDIAKVTLPDLTSDEGRATPRMRARVLAETGGRSKRVKARLTCWAQQLELAEHRQQLLAELEQTELDLAGSDEIEGLAIDWQEYVDPTTAAQRQQAQRE